MSRVCAFCPNPANTLEHLWPDWILKSLRASQPIRHTIGKRPPFDVKSPEVKTRAVCEQCNGGWMSNLEVVNRPLVGALIHDISAPIEPIQQANLAAWTMKTAMVLDAINSARLPFYQATERSLLRTNSTVPSGTTVWLGRHSGSSFHAGGTDVWLDQGEISKAARGCVTTIVVGHLAIQSFTVHALRPEYRDQPIETIVIKPGPWNELLCQVWPSGGTVSWPPVRTFTTGGRSSIAALMDRWRTGSAV
jgi:hypothetical protein